MPDVLTPAEIDAIARYTGPVTVCPPRTFSDEVPKIGGPNGYLFRGRSPDPAVAQRRERVAQMAAEGMSGAQIAAALGITRARVYVDVQEMRRDGREVTLQLGRPPEDESRKKRRP